MRIYRFLISFALVFAFGDAFGNPVSPAEAFDRACKKVTTRSESLELSLSVKSRHNPDVSTLYVFSGNDGFVIVPADDCAAPVLAYSDNPGFDPENIAPGLKYWLDFYSAEIENAISSGTAYIGTETDEKPEIPRLLNTQWNQGAPFNLDCPLYGLERTMTGCVATAMAQVMNYHRWPESCRGGEVSYQSRIDRYTMSLSIDFSEITFDWDNMLGNYSAEVAYPVNKSAVANLMKACGYAVRMNYSPSYSATSYNYIGQALNYYFNYSEYVQTLERSYYGLAEWEDIIYNQLKAGLPVLYGATTKFNEGHQFVCDGYRSGGFFHINWGWGGMSDGFFLLSALEPASHGIGGGSSAYTEAQEITINIAKPGYEIPGAMKYLLYCMDNFTTTGLGVNPEDDASETLLLGRAFTFFPGAYGGVINNGCVTVKGFFGILLQNDSGVAIEIYDPSLLTLSSFGSYNRRFVTLPEDLPEGEYTALPVFKVEGEDGFIKLRVPVSKLQSLNVKVSDGKATLTPGSVATENSGIDPVISANGTGAVIKVSKSGNLARIFLGKPVKSMSIYSLSGKNVYSSFDIDEPVVSVTLPRGIYTLVAQSYDGKPETVKIVL